MIDTQGQMRSSARKETVKVRYSGSNPPASEQEASDAVERLSIEVIRIETCLDHADPDIYPSDEAYGKWQRSAVGALGYIKGELAFLKRWLHDKQTSREKSVATDGLQETALRIRTRARELADELGTAYTQVYTSQSPPKDIAMAQARKEQILGLRQRLDSALSEVTAEWMQHPLRRKDLSGAKAPLLCLLAVLNEEASVVKKYLQMQALHIPLPDWKVVCAKALARATAEGFILTPEERTILNSLQKLDQT